MAFKLLKESAQDEYNVLRIASQAYAIGDLTMCDYSTDAVDVVPATSSAATTSIYAVAMEVQPATATQLLCCLIRPDQKWIADCTNTPAINDNFTRMLLTNANTVNNSHTDNTSVNAVFQQTGVTDVTNKRIVGRFLISNVSA